MSPPSNSSCPLPADDGICTIAADPDVAGIGVRVAVYLQALLPLFAMAIVPHSSIGTVAVDLLEAYSKRGNGSLVVFSATSTALLVTAFIKRAQRALSPYHALVILNCTWIILISSCCRAAVLFHVQTHIPGSFAERLVKATHARVRGVIPSKGQDSFLVGINDRALFYRFTRHVAFLVWHLIATGALGWMLFADIEGFAKCETEACPRDTRLWMFGSLVHITDHAPRLFWGIAYMTALSSPISLPLLSFPVFIIFNVACASTCALVAKISRSKTKQIPYLRAFEILSVATLVLLVVSTEITIAKNPVEHGENEWGFGQVLALVLAASVLYESMEDWRMARELRRASTPCGDAGEYRPLS